MDRSSSRRMGPLAQCLALAALAATARAACTCPDTPAPCTTDSLFSDSGEDDCVPNAAGLLDASIVMQSSSDLSAVDLGGITLLLRPDTAPDTAPGSRPDSRLGSSRPEPAAASGQQASRSQQQEPAAAGDLFTHQPTLTRLNSLRETLTRSTNVESQI